MYTAAGKSFFVKFNVEQKFSNLPNFITAGQAMPSTLLDKHLWVTLWTKLHQNMHNFNVLVQKHDLGRQEPGSFCLCHALISSKITVNTPHSII